MSVMSVYLRAGEWIVSKSDGNEIRKEKSETESVVSTVASVAKDEGVEILLSDVVSKPILEDAAKRVGAELPRTVASQSSLWCVPWMAADRLAELGYGSLDGLAPAVERLESEFGKIAEYAPKDDFLMVGDPEDGIDMSLRERGPGATAAMAIAASASALRRVGDPRAQLETMIAEEELFGMGGLSLPLGRPVLVPFDKEKVVSIDPDPERKAEWTAAVTAMSCVESLAIVKNGAVTNGLDGFPEFDGDYVIPYGLLSRLIREEKLHSVTFTGGFLAFSGSIVSLTGTMPLAGYMSSGRIAAVCAGWRAWERLVLDPGGPRHAFMDIMSGFAKD